MRERERESKKEQNWGNHRRGHCPLFSIVVLRVSGVGWLEVCSAGSDFAYQTRRFQKGLLDAIKHNTSSLTTPLFQQAPCDGVRASFLIRRVWNQGLRVVSRVVSEFSFNPDPICSAFCVIASCHNCMCSVSEIADSNPLTSYSVLVSGEKFTPCSTKK